MSNKYLLFISPHLDDVIFSISEYIDKMIDNNYQIIIATVFTKSNSSLLKNLIGDYYMYGDYITRILEDKNAIKSVNKNIIIKHLDFPEQMFRKTNNIIKPIFEKINNIIANYNVEKTFFPLSIGNHKDHKIIYNVSLLYRKKINIYYYFDYPYCTINLNTKTYLSSLGNFEKIELVDLYQFICHPIYKSCPILILLLKMLCNIFIYLLQ